MASVGAPDRHSEPVPLCGDRLLRIVPTGISKPFRRASDKKRRQQKPR